MPPYRAIKPITNLAKKIDSMILAHRVIVEILQTPNLADILSSLNDAKVRKAASADPLKAALDAGVKIPAKGVSIQIHEFPHTWEVEIQIEQDNSVLILEFNSLTGFRTS